MKASLPLFFVLILGLCPIPLHAASADTTRPNIIYILLDDAGYGDLSCYGQDKFQTPNIDRLASEGLKFTDHYSGSTVCAPTRCSLLTGLHTGHAFVRGNREVQPEGQAPMPADTVTIPRLLKKAGYNTGAFGKWGLGYPGSDSDPAKHFDVFYGYNCQREAHSYYPDHLWHNDQRIPLDGKTYSHTPIMDQALDFIRTSAQEDAPFFVYLPVTIPHAAMQVPEEYAAPWREKFPQFEDKVGKYGGDTVTNPIAMFAGMMTLLDDDIGRLLTLLDKLGIDDNTLVMLSSDNGPHREGGHDPDFFNSNGPVRGHKRDVWDGGVRVPLLARWPGTIKPGTTTGLVSAHWDLLPTFCELAETDPPANTDGISFVPTLLHPVGADQPAHDYLYWEFYEKGGKRAVRFGDWKAVQLNVASGGLPSIELYNIANDIGETNDVSDQHPEKVSQALKFFKEAHTPSPDWSFKKQAPKKKPAKKKA